MQQLAEAVRMITGWEVSVEELQRAGERRLNLLRAYNAREGIGREADVLPKKLKKALVGGKSDGLFVTEEEVERAKDWYYGMSGWEIESGTPTRAKLEQLDLAWVADMLQE
jgi:aldehyde:ferredoxin oxidoreductase